MRPRFAHRHNTAFARSSSLGEIHAAPVIEEVTMRRGNGAEKTIVKNGKIFQQKFGYQRHDIVTVKATLIVWPFSISIPLCRLPCFRKLSR